ncbi:TPA: transcription elongation factor GreA [Patescibacteria group bacterium]|nr:MAG: Transcription elongation factor GreA [Parcubacteria group bacterium GW2011_GWF2_40_10]KKR46779.1 MAG: Transcription elongation factor GreA [Parcubacteria group bacterium GW2011_GWA2_40_143]KKR59683.1 MAG: Transcription elongation factor GreA [Parcubacteria group bacterium GW2011_GWC2_40_31]KKR74576.1 MAG: Transcription elongation factor GreA [Parcubacteria group bacterium GW2011_GWB2_40_8]KKR75801.1 MAG: Transcription elongation factor GreA [Parcubacteria group bacterium GW2011_GWE2_40_
MNNAEYLSREGLDKIKNELQELTTVGRKNIASRLEYAKSLGDLSENSEYKEALESQRFLEEKIARYQDVVNRAVVVEKPTGTSVQVGSTVKVKKEGDKDMKTYIIVNKEEANIASSKLSYDSPLGKELIGKKKGDKIKIETPSGDVSYSVEDLS